jgi:hypothetical protein
MISTSTFDFTKFCYMDETTKDIQINYKIIKNKINEQNYNVLTNIIVETINQALHFKSYVNTHINLNSFTLTDIEKHYKYICILVKLLTTNYPDKLNVCYVYECPFIFNTLYSMLSTIIDKKTKEKIHLIC